MSRSHDEIWGEILRTAWLVRSQHDASVERVEESLVDAFTQGRDVVPLSDLNALAELASDAIILVGLIEEHERAYPTEAGRRLPPQPR